METMVLRYNTTSTFTVHTDLLFDSRAKVWRKNTSIVVDPETGLIDKIYTRKNAIPQDVNPLDVDLRGLCVLPGLVDAHTHLLLHPYVEASSLVQERDESLVECVIRATNHCRSALMAGYTTYRDMGTEGAGDADVHIRDAVNRGIIPGPRIFCVTECLASSGGYEVRIESHDAGTRTSRLSDPCDGDVGVRRGVRRRLAAGADIVKFYADYRKRELRWPKPVAPGCPDLQFPPAGEKRNPNRLLFTQAEVNAIVDEAKTSKAPVAAHASSAAGVLMAAKAGVTTIEHGNEELKGSGAREEMVKQSVIWVPTLSIVEISVDKDTFQDALDQVREGFEMGIKLAAGGDTGPFPHGDNARELELMVKAGIPLDDVLVAATVHGWEACGGDECGRRFGWLEEGCAADLIALQGDVRHDLRALRRVQWVLKDGKVYKQDGKVSHIDSRLKPWEDGHENRTN